MINENELNQALTLLDRCKIELNDFLKDRFRYYMKEKKIKLLVKIVKVLQNLSLVIITRLKRVPTNSRKGLNYENRF